MTPPSLPPSVTYRITQTAHGWLLVIANPHCSLTQLYETAASARQAVPRSVVALETLTTQHLARHERARGQI